MRWGGGRGSGEQQLNPTDDEGRRRCCWALSSAAPISCYTGKGGGARSWGPWRGSASTVDVDAGRSCSTPSASTTSRGDYSRQPGEPGRQRDGDPLF